MTPFSLSSCGSEPLSDLECIDGDMEDDNIVGKLCDPSLLAANDFVYLGIDDDGDEFDMRFCMDSGASTVRYVSGISMFRLSSILLVACWPETKDGVAIVKPVGDAVEN